MCSCSCGERGWCVVARYDDSVGSLLDETGRAKKPTTLLNGLGITRRHAACFIYARALWLSRQYLHPLMDGCGYACLLEYRRDTIEGPSCQLASSLTFLEGVLRIIAVTIDIHIYTFLPKSVGIGRTATRRQPNNQSTGTRRFEVIPMRDLVAGIPGQLGGSVPRLSPLTARGRPLPSAGVRFYLIKNPH